MKRGEGHDCDVVRVSVCLCVSKMAVFVSAEVTRKNVQNENISRVSTRQAVIMNNPLCMTNYS